MQKPILRWTIGDVSKHGFDCLEFSIKSFLNLYNDKFDYFVCYNNIEKNKLNFLKKQKVKILCQHDYENDLNLKPIAENPCWKIYPPRIDIEKHEIFIDNDLVIYRKLPLIDLFLFKKNLFFITEAIKRSYGAFDSMVQSKLNLNTGFFGLPPGYDFAKEINEVFIDKKISWKNHLDEQGLVSFLLLKKNLEIIRLGDIYVCHKDFPYKEGKYGQHFVQLNRKDKNNFSLYWNRFIAEKETKKEIKI